MGKPFKNAYDALKNLFNKLFRKGEIDKEQETELEEGQNVAESTGEEKVEAEVKDTDKSAKDSAKEDKVAEAKEDNTSKAKEDKASKEKEEKAAKAKETKETKAAKKKAEKATYDEAVKKADREEEKRYQEEVRKRAARKARRERKEDVESATGKKITDPVTGESMSLGSLPEEAVYLQKYMRITSTADDILVAINSIVKHPNMPKNIVILGRNGFGTVKVGEDFARSLYDMKLVKSDKIAKIKAKQLNKIGLEKLNSLKGGCLIVENAGLVNFAKLVEVIKNSAEDVNDYVVILTGEIDSLFRFFDENAEINDSFIYLVDIHKIREHGMIALAKGYIQEKGFTADKPVYDKLKASLQSMEIGNIDRFIELMDKAMANCESRVKVLESDTKELTTQDF